MIRSAFTNHGKDVFHHVADLLPVRGERMGRRGKRPYQIEAQLSLGRAETVRWVRGPTNVKAGAGQRNPSHSFSSANLVLAVIESARILIGMKIVEIRNLLHAQPFRPFFIHIADGGRIPVKHEDFVALGPAGREMIVYQPDNTHQIVDVMLVTRLEILAKNGAKKPHK